MVVSASKVKSLCTDSEYALVRASRQPALGQLSASQLKRLAARARKLVEKWQGQRRQQARTVSRDAGRGSTAANTRLKTQVLVDALQSIESRLARLDSPVAAGGAKSQSKSKKVRSAGHRKARAKVRKELAGHD